MFAPDEFGYSLRELADLNGLSPRTIHYYSAQGLLPPADRRGAGARYPQVTLDRLRAIQVLKFQMRLTLQEIRRVLGRLSTEQVGALASGELLPSEVLARPEVRASAARSIRTAGPSPTTPDPVSRAASRVPTADEARPAPASVRSVTTEREPAVVGSGEASAQLASLVRTLDSRAGRTVPRAGSRDHWLSIPITADLQISAHRVNGEDIEVLRRVADHLRALLVRGFADDPTHPGRKADSPTASGSQDAFGAPDA